METQLTEETLQAVEDCGAAEMPIPETLEIAELTAEDWKTHPEAAKRYKRGQLKTKLAIRQAIVKGARSGNPALLKAYQDFTAETKEEQFSHLPAEKDAETPPQQENGGEFDNI